MAWDFAAEIHALSNFDADLEGTTGSISGENLSLHTNQWLEQGAKEIISVLPPKLKEKCMTESTITNSPSYLSDLDGIGDILHVTRLSADSGGFRVPCREVLSMYGEMTGDSTDLMFYASVTDPVYWITSSNDATILNVNPTPTANQTAIVYHVAYPTITFGQTSIANFPDEAEYLVVLYAACKALQHKMTELHALIPSYSDQDGTHTAPGGFTGDSSGSQGWEVVRHWIETEEDSEMASINMQALNTEMQQFVGEYQWYESKLAGIKKDYVQGLQLLASGDARNLVSSGARKATEGQKVSA